MGDPVGVEDAVEKMLGKGPAAEEAEQEQPPSKAAAEHTSDKGEQDSKETAGKDADSVELSAFEQELIGELDQEDREVFNAADPAEQKRQLAFMKKAYRRQARQMTELGTLRKAVGTLRDAGITNEDLVKLVQSKQGGTKAEAQRTVDQAAASGNGKRGFQRWMSDELKADERENIREAEQVVRELVEDIVTGVLDKEVKPIRERLDFTDRQQMTERAQGLEAEINTLEDDLGYPGSLVETYRQEMLRIGLREPKLSVEDLLVRAAGFQTVKAAMLKTQGKADAGQREEEEQKPPSKPGSTVIKKPVQGSVDALPRKRTGSISINAALDLLMRPKR